MLKLCSKIYIYEKKRNERKNFHHNTLLSCIKNCFLKCASRGIIITWNKFPRPGPWLMSPHIASIQAHSDRPSPRKLRKLMLLSLFAASRIRYEITSGNIGGAFAVKNMTGAIYVAGALDYETRKRVSTEEKDVRLYANETTFVFSLVVVDVDFALFSRASA